MINRKDVIRMKIPFPNMSSDLAADSHMYICRNGSYLGRQTEYIKCQSWKPYMLTSRDINHFVDEEPDINRNPFMKKTRIDCDKVFCTSSLVYPDSMKTTRRPDVSEDVMQKVESELLDDGYAQNNLNENELRSLNPVLNMI